MRSFTFAVVLSATILFGAWAMPAHALIVNGGFELGFSGWTRADQVGSEGTFQLQTGTVSPVTLSPVPPPPEGLTAAMTDAEGPGSHVLYQDIMIPAAVGPTTLSFQLFVQNSAPAFFVAPGCSPAQPTRLPTKASSSANGSCRGRRDGRSDMRRSVIRKSCTRALERRASARWREWYSRFVIQRR